MNAVAIRFSPARGEATGPAAPAAAVSLLTTPGGIDAGAAISAVLQLSAAAEEAQSRSSAGQAGAAAARREIASSARKEAIARSIEAAREAEAREDGGPFDLLTDNLGPIGLVGLVVGGAYLVAADLAAHAVGLENDELDLADAGGLAAMLAGPVGTLAYAAELGVKKLGPDELQAALEEGPTIADDDVRTANKVALTVVQAELALAATLASGGTAAPAVIAMVGIGVSTSTQILSDTGALRAVAGAEAAGFIALGGSVAGAGLSLGGGLAAGGSASEGAKVARALERAKTAVTSMHAVRRGITNLEAAAYTRESAVATVEATRQKHVLALVERMIDQVIEDMSGLADSARRTTELCRSIHQTQNETLLLAANLKG